MLESAQSKLRRLHSTAHNSAAFKHQAAVTGLRQIRRRDQAVVARARHDDVEPLNLSEVARSAAELYEPVAEEKGFVLKIETEPDVTMRGARHLLSQALANLLDNALKYARGGEIRIRVFHREGRAVLDVADRGPGIPEADRETVFDRFVRLEPSRSSPGNGLGLSLVRAIVRRHRGTVEIADNRPGLRVRLEFPRLVV